MILVFQKRVLMGLSFTLLCTPMMPTKAYDSNMHPAVVGGLIGAGIVACAGIAYGIAQLCKKSPEQIADDAQKAFNTAHRYGQCFYAEYMHTFERGPAYGESVIDHTERNFLKPVACHAQERHIDVGVHIDAVHRSIEALATSLQEVKEAINGIQSNAKNNQKMRWVYDRLIDIERDIEAQLAYLKAYYHRFSDHRAYFVLFEFESKLHEKYRHELTNQYPAYSYQFEKQLLHRARTHNVNSDYPLVRYQEQLHDHIATLERYIRELKYWYPERTTAAKQLRDYLVYIRNVTADTPAFKEERERKKEDDARREMLALREREVQAQAQMAMAAAQQAQAAMQQAQAAQQRVYLEQARLAQQPTVVVVSNKC